MTVAVVSQPRFFPGTHWLHRMRQADWFVVFDTVQFNPRHEENRARLKGPQGPFWLTVPVQKHARDQRIADILVSHDQPWQQNALRTLEHLYGKCPHYERFRGEVEAVIRAGHENLVDLDEASWQPALRILQPSCRFVRASALPVAGRGPQLLLDICQHLGADVYLSGGFGREYLDPEQFAARGVEVRFHDYTPAVYPQRFGAFEPWLSYLDVLFQNGLEPTVAV